MNASVLCFMMVGVDVRPESRSILFRSAATAGVFAHAAFLEDDFQRAEVRERGLQQVEPDKCGEPEPVLAVIVREPEAQKDE